MKNLRFQFLKKSLNIENCLGSGSPHNNRTGNPVSSPVLKKFLKMRFWLWFENQALVLVQVLLTGTSGSDVSKRVLAQGWCERTHVVVFLVLMSLSFCL
jgi:hypothetical protein